MKKALIEPISYVDEMVVLVSKQEKLEIDKIMSKFIAEDKLSNQEIVKIKSRAKPNSKAHKK